MSEVRLPHPNARTESRLEKFDPGGMDSFVRGKLVLSSKVFEPLGLTSNPEGLRLDQVCTQLLNNLVRMFMPEGRIRILSIEEGRHPPIVKALR